jgi:TolA-binding protein
MISSRPAAGMQQKSTIQAAFFALSLFAPILIERSAAQPAIAPIEVVSPATKIRLYNEAQKAFLAKQYDGTIAKIEELIKALGDERDQPQCEELYFTIGLCHLLTERHADAEKSFVDCMKKFPKGEYLSRCYLGVGRAAMLQGNAAKNERAINALKLASKDPKYRSEAGLWLGQVYSSIGKHDEALAVFRTLMGSDIRTPQQTTAAVEVVGLLADLGKLDDLCLYLDSLGHQSGVRDSISWFANQIIVRGDGFVANEAYEPALIIYRSVPTRTEIISVQTAALESMRKDANLLEARAKADETKPLSQRSSAPKLLASLKPAIAQAETALKAIEEKADLDASLLMRRGRCLFYLERHEEALLCFRTIRTKHATATDAEAAAYAEIVILNKIKDIPAIKDRCDEFLRKYPASDKAEQVATLAGEVLVQNGNWKEVGKFYRSLEEKFPQSASLDRFVFFQGLALFQEGNMGEATSLFDRFIKSYSTSQLQENAHYYVAMCNFLGNKYKETLAACKEYLRRFPDGRYAGDMQYRLSFIDFNDKEDDQTTKIIRDLSGFLAENPDDLANGSMLCLLADTYKKQKTATDQEAESTENKALECYVKAVWTESPDDVIQYALDSATNILKARKDWVGVGNLHGEFLKRKPDSQIALLSATQVAQMYARQGKGAEAAELLAGSLKSRIADPTIEAVEFLMDELVKTLVPRKKPKDLDSKAIDAQLVEILNKIIQGQENPTTAARLYYARARLAEMLRDPKTSNIYMKGIATTNAANPAALSPMLLAVSGDILLKEGDLDGAEAYYRRLADRYADSMFSDAGPVGLGYVALARKKPEDALKIFENALTNIAGMSRFKEATLGKLEALVEVGKLEDAEKLAVEMVGDPAFKGETVPKAYLIQAKAFRNQAKNTSSINQSVSRNWLAKANAVYQRVYVAYKRFPELSAEALWGSYEINQEIGEPGEAEKVLKLLASDQKLKETAYGKKAAAALP